MYGISCNLGYISCPIVVIGLCMSCRSNNTTTMYNLAVISIRGFFRHLVPQMEYFHTSMKYCLPILFTICWLCISAGRNLRANFGPWLLSGWKKLPSPPTAIQTPTPSPPTPSPLAFTEPRYFMRVSSLGIPSLIQSSIDDPWYHLSCRQSTSFAVLDNLVLYIKHVLSQVNYTKLGHLNVSYNNISELTASIFQWPRLSYLDFKHNPLTTLYDLSGVTCDLVLKVMMEWSSGMQHRSLQWFRATLLYLPCIRNGYSAILEAIDCAGGINLSIQTHQTNRRYKCVFNVWRDFIKDSLTMSDFEFGLQHPDVRRVWFRQCAFGAIYIYM